MSTDNGQRSERQAACQQCSESDCYHAGLHAGHIWTNVRCPAYVTRNGDDCTCDPSKRETTYEQAGRAADDEETDDVDDVQPINLDRVCSLVLAAGVPCEVEQTGGGTATIYAGPLHERSDDPDWPRHAAAMGPGYFEQHIGRGAYLDARAWREECYIGADDDGESRDYIAAEDLTEEQCAAALIGLSVCTFILYVWEGF